MLVDEEDDHEEDDDDDEDDDHALLEPADPLDQDEPEEDEPPPYPILHPPEKEEDAGWFDQPDDGDAQDSVDELCPPQTFELPHPPEGFEVAPQVLFSIDRF